MRTGYKTRQDWENDVERYKGLWEEAKRKHAWEDAAFYKAKMNDARAVLRHIMGNAYGR